MVCCLVAAAASWSRGARYVHGLTDVGVTAPARRPLLARRGAKRRLPSDAPAPAVLLGPLLR